MTDTTAKYSFRGKQSFFPVVYKLKVDEACSLKRHFWGCIREVAGYLDHLAKKNPQRFVYASIQTITEGCNKYRKDEPHPPYSVETVKKAIQFLRDLGVVSAEVHRDGRRGFIVMPHDMLAARKVGGKLSECRWIGLLPHRPPTKGARVMNAAFYPGPSPEDVERDRQKGRTLRAARQAAKTGGIVPAAVPAELATVPAAVPAELATVPAAVPLKIENCTLVDDPNCTLVNSDNPEKDKDLLDSESKNALIEKQETRGLAVVAVSQSAVVTEVKAAVRAEVMIEFSQENRESQRQNQQQEENQNPQSLDSSIRLTDQNQNQENRGGSTPTPPSGSALRPPEPPASSKVQIETIRSHFRDGVSFEIISDGELDEKLGNARVTSRYLGQLLDCCKKSVGAKSALPYLGRKTNGDLMADSMVLFKEETGENAPACWYPTIKRLREGGPALRNPESEDQTSLEKLIGGPAKTSLRCKLVAAAYASNIELFDQAVWDDLIPYSRDSSVLDNWRSCWQFLAKMENLNEGFQQLRDWLFEHDDLPEKPANPPWKKK
jgi:hypothetical protein